MDHAAISLDRAANRGWLDGMIFATSSCYNEHMPGNDAMKPASPGVKLTYDDFVLFPDDGKRHELIDGEHYVTPSPTSKHQTIAWNLGGLIWTYLQSHPIGRAFAAPLDVVFSHFDVVEPDLLFVSAERRDKILTDKNIQGAPDLVVEIGSPSTRKRDETIKRRLYERFGVVEYWVIDPELDAIKVYRRDGDRYQRVAELTLEAGDALTSPLLPGLSLPLSKIFEE
jgi:Uma2 family endonuclease